MVNIFLYTNPGSSVFQIGFGGDSVFGFVFYRGPRLYPYDTFFFADLSFESRLSLVACT